VFAYGGVQCVQALLRVDSVCKKLECAVSDKSGQIECPVDGCHADMTAAVYEQCGETVFVPMGATKSLYTTSRAHASSANTPVRVALQCPKGHWAEYPCPRSDK
jgi:hypothetical protein